MVLSFWLQRRGALVTMDCFSSFLTTVGSRRRLGGAMYAALATDFIRLELQLSKRGSA